VILAIILLEPYKVGKVVTNWAGNYRLLKGESQCITVSAAGIYVKQAIDKFHGADSYLRI